jgi:hypothetical protein
MSAVKKAFGQVKEISGEVKAKINDIREKEWAEPTGAILKGRFHKKLKTSGNVEDCVLILPVKMFGIFRTSSGIQFDLSI